MKKIVTIGGGTGQSTLLSGLRNYDLKISAIVSVADDGGSSGRLRNDLGVLPQGDIWKCVLALSELQNMRSLLKYRFSSGELSGHSLGNILFAGAEKKIGRNNYLETMAVFFKIKGEVIPASLNNITLLAKFADKKEVCGEDNIENSNIQIGKNLKFFLKGKLIANPMAVLSILDADLVVIGPADLYTNLGAIILIPGIKNALKKTKARLVFVVNLLNKKGHTLGFSVLDYTNYLEDIIGRRLDFLVLNTKNPPQNIIDRKEKYLIKYNLKKLKAQYRVIYGDFSDKAKVIIDKGDKIAKNRSNFRHSSKKLAQAIWNIIKV